MLDWIDVNSSVKPPENRVLLCYCPEWSETGFYYYEEPNEQFGDLVEKWAVFETAD